MPFNAKFLFHGSLNDFLPKSRKGAQTDYPFERNPSVKDAIEALGVPHPEVAAILVNGQPVNFQYLLQPDDRVEVFPKMVTDADFKGNILQPPLPEKVKFVLDVHLGKLAKVLRMLGFDTVYQNDYSDKEIAGLAQTENRIVLTRDVNLLKIKIINWGYWLRSQHLEEQLVEVMRYFELENKVTPFTRCLACNGLILPVEKQEIINDLPPNTRQYFHEFYQCESCRKVYWKGSHFERMHQFIKRFSLG